MRDEGRITWQVGLKQQGLLAGKGGVDNRVGRRVAHVSQGDLIGAYHSSVTTVRWPGKKALSDT